tara:strand:+ start:1160 stop:1756 length:597 start_codon:yes stop_codon:yes gene_type:complete
MIKFINNSSEIPYVKFKEKYDQAYSAKQGLIEAIAISSYSSDLNEVNSRFVNLKILNSKEFIFFSNYNSPKSQEFSDHNQITALIYWRKTNVQIRLKAIVKKTSQEFNKAYFLNRSKQKNALAISSNQSKPIDSFERVKKNYNRSLELDNLKECPDYWGGFSFIPYYFEFWEGHESRLNKRDVYEINGSEWNNLTLQP